MKKKLIALLFLAAALGTDCYHTVDMVYVKDGVYRVARKGNGNENDVFEFCTGSPQSGFQCKPVTIKWE